MPQLILASTPLKQRKILKFTNFQACTGIEDLEVAILQLEEANWNLTVSPFSKRIHQIIFKISIIFKDAVNKAIPAVPPEPEQPQLPAAVPPSVLNSSSLSTPEDSSVAAAAFNPFSSVPQSSSTSNIQPQASNSPPILIDDSPTTPFSRVGVSTSDDFFSAGPSSYSARTRMLEFNIQHNNRMIQLKVPDTEDLKTLKLLLQGETGFPPCQQDLRGFKVNVFPMSDHRKLSELSLPKENFLYLLTPTSPEEASGGGESSSATNGDPAQPGAEDEDADFVLEITDEAQNREYSLNFRRKAFSKMR